MKFLIDADEKLVCEGFERSFTEEERDILIRAIGNGKPYNERPHAKWITRRIIAKNRSFDMIVCSNCQTEFSYDAETGVSMDNYNTCPNCGADMKGDTE